MVTHNKILLYFIVGNSYPMNRHQLLLVMLAAIQRRLLTIIDGDRTVQADEGG